MDDSRKYKIGYQLLVQHLLKNEGLLFNSRFKDAMDNASETLGISSDEMSEFAFHVADDVIALATIQTERELHIKTQLGDDFDPRKLQQVLNAFDQFDFEKGLLFDKEKCAIKDFSPEAEREIKAAVCRLWARVRNTLGTEDFAKCYGKSVGEAVETMFGMLFNNKPRT